MPKVRRYCDSLTFETFQRMFIGHFNLRSNCLGKITRGYDPSQDIIWLRSEIVRWIEGNLVEKWYVGRPAGCASLGLIWLQGIHQTSSYGYQSVHSLNSNISGFLTWPDLQKRTRSKLFKTNFRDMAAYPKPLLGPCRIIIRSRNLSRLGRSKPSTCS